MSEELQSKYLRGSKIIGQKLGEFQYFQLGATTLKQLKEAKLVPAGFAFSYATAKPDRLIIDRSDISKPRVIAIVEDKKVGKFNSEIEKVKAVQQCNNYCQEVGAKIGIITDGRVTIWINSQQQNKETIYVDKTTGGERSYSLLKKEDGSEVTRNFICDTSSDLLTPESMPEDIRKTYKLIKEADLRIGKDNSIVKEPERIDPLPLARRVWQDIWVATGKSPEKCLYNVVELFIFKFLSDLEILIYPNNFDSLYQLIEKGRSADEVLKYYVKNCREEINNQFPKGDDGTTIINGTIFVDEKGDANTTQSFLFKETIKKFKDFEIEFGKFSTHNIDKDFKTKLYEAFLKQTAGIKALGQYFTPRKVVRAIVEMSGVQDFRGGESICDPFCGVGGFVLEPLNMPERAEDFRPRNGKVNSPIFYRGYDKGFEKDEERTIILAKANMLIYLAELVAESKLTREFANNAFNKTFTLWRSNLGTLGQIATEEENKFDLILTNPPYVKRGIKTLKSEISENAELKAFYQVNGGGLEGLALEWIIKHLKKGGRAFVVVPDGLLNRIDDKKLRRFVLDECNLETIISLPQKTFYATTKKTYILGIAKKRDREQKQNHPVFTYLVSNIGETLNVNRFEQPENNDLPNMVDLFKEFSIYKEREKVAELNQRSPRCKIQSIDKFESANSWCIDRWWTQEEKVELGVEEEIEVVTPSEFVERMQEAENSFRATLSQMVEIVKKKSYTKVVKAPSWIRYPLSEIIDFKQGTNNSQFTKRFVDANKGKVPVYSASEDPNEIGYGYVADKLPGVKYFQDCMTWNIDGSVGKVFIREGRFTLSEKVIPLIIQDKYLHILKKDYLKIVIENAVAKEGFAFNNKAGKSRLQVLEIPVPLDEKGKPDIRVQEEIVLKNKELSDIQESILSVRQEVADLNINFSEIFDYEDVKLSDLFTIKQGSAYYTKKHILGNGWTGETPVYSSNTKQSGLLMKIDLEKIKPEDIYYQYCLTWAVDGYAGKLFIRNEENISNTKRQEYFFTLNNHCGILLPKREDLYLPFLQNILQPIFFEKAKGYGNNKVGTNQIQDISVKMPLSKGGKFDVEKQKEISKRYEVIDDTRNNLLEKLDNLISLKVSVEEEMFS